MIYGAKRIIPLLSIAFIVGLILIINRTSENLQPIGYENKKPPITVEIENNTAPKNIVKSHLNKTQWNPMGDAASEREIKSWFAARGNYSFYDPEEQNDYKNYDVTTLINLANQGDIKAMHILADTAKTAKDLKPMLNRAAIYGSTQAIIELGSLCEIDDGEIRNKPPLEQKAKILGAFAYFETAKMRGDWTGVILYGKSLLERYNITLSDEDQKTIQENAQKIYTEIQQQRTAEGLGNFDNHIPESVMNYYKEMLKPL